MGSLLKDKPGQQLVGGGRRASTLRSRVRGARKFLSSLAINRELNYSTSSDQLPEFLHVRLSEPCNKRALKGTHQSFIFLEEMVGTPAQERFRGSALYGVIYQEVRRITNMQRSVITALQSHSSDPFAEEESIRDFDAFMESQSLDAAQRTLCFKSLEAVKLVTPLHGQQELTLRNPEEPEDDVVTDDTEAAFHAVQPQANDRKATRQNG